MLKNEKRIKIGSKYFPIGQHTYVMGILNVTPDSFSDGGKWVNEDAALKRVEQMITEGMDIIDIGGESTRPGHTQISEQEEIERVLPLIETIKKRFDIPVSLDTYKAKVAEAGITAGIDMINDIWGLKKDKKMAEVIAQNDVACCLMHNRDNGNDCNVVDQVITQLQESIDLAKKYGISADKIILDPGIGFGKSYIDNMQLLQNLEKLNILNYPLLLGTSRKSVIGLTLDTPVEERLEGTLVTTVLAVQSGFSFVRVHDIKENVRTIRMVEAIKQGGMALYG